MSFVKFIACLFCPPFSAIFYKDAEVSTIDTIRCFIHAPKTRFAYWSLLYFLLFIVLSFVLLIRFCVAPHSLEYLFLALFLSLGICESAGYDNNIISYIYLHHSGNDMAPGLGGNPQHHNRSLIFANFLRNF